MMTRHERAVWGFAGWILGIVGVFGALLVMMRLLGAI